jgi:hypothetical protein
MTLQGANVRDIMVQQCMPRPKLPTANESATFFFGLHIDLDVWSLTSLREKLVKTGAKVVRHGRYAIFQMAEVAVPRELFQEILRLIGELRPQPPPAPA